ncbi:MAG: ROK family protein [Pyrinomonadaceae bacterium MAG19_C2-C3]|nr:ROK family protein [Pyrinomonadaceae bacterium MAG19_C2-C3]
MDTEETVIRPASPAASHIGVALSHNLLRATLLDSSGTPYTNREMPLERDTAALIPQIAELTRSLQSEASSSLSSPVSGLGIGVPGLVNPSTNRIEISSDLPALVGFDLHGELARALNLPVTLTNDANAAAYAEYQIGAGRNSRSLFYALIGNGIGGALIIDGRPWLGVSGFAGEFGYMAVDAEGDVLEAVASAPNIVRRTRERLARDSTSSLSKLALNRNFTAADIAHEAKEGDDFALLMIERTGRYIGIAIASVINLLNIERIVLGGAVMDAGDLILDPIIREAKRRSFQPCFDATQITLATLGNDAVALGAGLLARNASSLT